jgi:UDP-glucose 4-epimerase
MVLLKEVNYRFTKNNIYTIIRSKEENMNILVIGGAGYIGSHVTRLLLDSGFNVTVYDNMSSGCSENIFKEASFVKGDILDYDQLQKTMKKGFDAIIHLAALKAAGESMLKPESYSLNNISGTINILNAASESGIKKIVFSSSAAIFGEPKYLPMDEVHPTEPINYYGFTKLEIEKFLYWYDKLKGINYVALRYFNAAGYDKEGRITGLEKNPANLLPVIMEVACGKRDRIMVFGNDYDTKDGTGVRDYIHVSDLASAHKKAIEYLSGGKSLLVNLGSEHGISVNEMIESARKITGKPIRTEIASRRPGDPATVIASSKKALEVLNWKPVQSDVNTLVESTWKIYQKHFG